MKITGKFEVSMEPMDSNFNNKDGINMSRMAITKTYHGDLSAESHGEMLSAMTKTEGSAGYVALEQVKGTLMDKKGSFVLQHYGIMNRGKDSLILEIVPDSGTGELKGITGKMAIRVENDTHYYELEYEF